MEEDSIFIESGIEVEGVAEEGPEVHMDEDEPDGEWGGIEGMEESNVAQGGPNGHKGGPKVNVTPTRDEIRAINEASELFKSNTFKLQVRNA